MTAEERDRRLEEIRARHGRVPAALALCKDVMGHDLIKAYGADIGFLLAELDAAGTALHDLREESTAYRRGLEEGVRFNLNGIAFPYSVGAQFPTTPEE